MYHYDHEAHCAIFNLKLWDVVVFLNVHHCNKGTLMQLMPRDNTMDVLSVFYSTVVCMLAKKLQSCYTSATA